MADTVREAVAVDEKGLAAAWAAWHSRHGGKLGPGPAFVEAISAYLSATGGEPVGWMWTHEDGSRSFVSDEDTKRIWVETMKRDLVAVYRHPAPPDALKVAVEALEKLLRRAEDGAGTLPAKEAVKLRPKDWHAIGSAIRALATIRAQEDGR